jgi:NADH-quinone oxidoreductase subunit H
MNTTQLVWTLIKIAVMVGFAFNVAGLLTWYDRRGGALMQDRIGPNRAVIKIFGFELRLAGLLHPAADGVKFFFKEDFMPPKADKLLFSLAPMLAMIPVIALLAVIPFGDTLCWGPQLVRKACVGGAGEVLRIAESVKGSGNFDQCVDAAGAVVGNVTPSTVWPWVLRDGVCSAGPGVYPIDLTIAPLNVGILYVFAMAGQGIVGAAIAGWSSDNKFSLMGALRAASQMVSYEVTMGLTLVGAMMIYGTVQLDHMVRWQGDNAWGIFVQPLAFFLFFAAAVAESKRIPFDLPEAESELVSGYFTEYSGMKFGMFYFAEYMEVVTSSMLLVTIFLGGWELPFLHRDGLTIAFGDATLAHVRVPHVWVSILQVLAFFGKVLALCWIQAFVRWSLPRFRYDQLMKLGWRVILPASLANIAVTAVLWLAYDSSTVAFKNGMKLVADLTQGLVALVLTVLVLRAVVGMFLTRKKERAVVGSAAEIAEEAGGVKSSPMQA